MIDNAGERFLFSYERDAAASCLVVRTGVNEKVRHYQVQMVAYNKIQHVLPFTLRQKDNELAFYYNVTSKLSLAQFMKKKSIKLEAFAAILSDMAAALLGCSSYLLSDRNFLIDENYIFINPETSSVHMVYIPVLMDEDINERLKSFIIRLIMKSVDTGGERSAGNLQRILNFVKSETFNVADLKKMLDGVIYGSNMESQLCSSMEEPDFQPKTAERSNDKDRKVPLKAGTPDIGNEKSQEAAPSGMRLGAVIAIVQIAAVLAGIMGFALLKGNDPVSFGALVIILAALDTVVVKKLLEVRKLSSNRKGITLPEKPIQPKAGKVSVQKNIHEGEGKIGQSDIKNHMLEESWKPETPEIKESTDTSQKSIRSSNETMILTIGKREYPCLQSIKDPFQEEILITKPSFILGRIREHVDYVFDNSAIGKIHAEIITRDGAYYIKDLNSKNGTFINDVIINSNMEYEIKNNDRITFANSEYIFLTP